MDLMTSGVETSHTLREKEREAGKLCLFIQCTQKCFLSVCLQVENLKKKKKRQFKVSTAQTSKKDTQHFRERIVLTSNKKK